MKISRVARQRPVIPTLKRLRKEDHELEFNLDNTVRPISEKKGVGQIFNVMAGKELMES